MAALSPSIRPDRQTIRSISRAAFERSHDGGMVSVRAYSRVRNGKTEQVVPISDPIRQAESTRPLSKPWRVVLVPRMTLAASPFLLKGRRAWPIAAVAQRRARHCGRMIQRMPLHLQTLPPARHLSRCRKSSPLVDNRSELSFQAPVHSFALCLEVAQRRANFSAV